MAWQMHWRRKVVTIRAQHVEKQLKAVFCTEEVEFAKKTFHTLLTYVAFYLLPQDNHVWQRRVHPL